MARPMVTRTIITTNATVMCLDTEEQVPVFIDVTVPRTYKTEEALLKVARPLIETETVKAVKVTSTEQVETLYGMPEQTFIENAVVLPPRNKEA